MREVTFIIGLPGSGKSTLIEYYKTHPIINYIVFDDWMLKTVNSFSKDDFRREVRYKELIQAITNNNHVIISGIGFCKSEDLIIAEKHLNLMFPNIKINKVYFDNNPENCCYNVKYREEKKGGYWTEPDENGDTMFYGTIFNDLPLYRLERDTIKELTKTYSIPEEFNPLPVLIKKD